jgi:glycosyltransferase involved in cell wall biosynthesis
MALLLKPFRDGEKGVIVFTHKEIDNGSVSMRQESRVLKRLETLRDRYMFGVHIGGAVPLFPAFDALDFYLAPESVQFVRHTTLAGKRLFTRTVEVCHIPLCARSFLPASFGKEQCPKQFDIIMIARAAVNKHLEEFFTAIKKIYAAGKEYRVLLISADPNVHSDGAVDLAELYYGRLTARERDLFSVMYLSSRMSMFPLPSSTISFLMRSSKVCALFSMAEGDSRNVHEALMADMPVVVCRNMIGGARDNLNAGNSVQFSDFGDAHEALIEAVEKHSFFQGIRAKIEPLCSEAHSIPRLENALKELFQRKGLAYTPGGLHSENLSLTLAAHTRDRTPDGKTLDLLTPDRILSWLDGIPG